MDRIWYDNGGLDLEGSREVVRATEADEQMEGSEDRDETRE